MKYDLAKKGPKATNDSPMLVGAIEASKKDEPSYPCASVYDLPDGVEGIKAGDMVTIGAKIKSLRTNEEGVQSMELDLMHMEDGKKEVSMKKKEKDEDVISKAVDEAADEDDSKDEE